MNCIARIFARDLTELALSRGLLALVLVAPVVLMLLIGQLKVRDPVTQVAIVETRDDPSKAARLRGLVDELSDVETRVWKPEAGSLREDAVRERIDVVASLEGDAWRFYTPLTDPYRLRYAQEVVQDLVLSQQRRERLDRQQKSLAELRAELRTPDAADGAAQDPESPVLARIGELEQRERDEAEVPTPVLRAWLASRLQPYFPPATRTDHSLVPGFVALIAVFLPFLLASGALVREREAGTLPTLLIATQRSWLRLSVGKLLLPPFISMLVTLLLLVMARTVFGFGVKPGLPAVLAMQAMAALVSALLGLSLSTLIRSLQDAYTASAVYLVALILITGLIYPVEQAAQGVILISHAFPLTLSRLSIDEWMAMGAAATIKPSQAVGLVAQVVAAGLLCAISLRRMQKSL